MSPRVVQAGAANLELGVASRGVWRWSLPALFALDSAAWTVELAWA